MGLRVKRVIALRYDALTGVDKYDLHNLLFYYVLACLTSNDAFKL